MTLAKRTVETAPGPANLTAGDFWRLAESGAFAGNARTELIDGEIWVVNSVHRWHARVTGIMHLALARSIDAGKLELDVLIAGSVDISENSVPEPDLSVIVPIHEDARAIEKDELRIAVEITDSTEGSDLGRKATLYALHGIPEYWVVLRDRRLVMQMWSPTDLGYVERRAVRFGERIESATIEELAVETDGIAECTPLPRIEDIPQPASARDARPASERPDEPGRTRTVQSGTP